MHFVAFLKIIGNEKSKTFKKFDNNEKFSNCELHWKTKKNWKIEKETEEDIMLKPPFLLSMQWLGTKSIWNRYYKK